MRQFVFLLQFNVFFKINVITRLGAGQPEIWGSFTGRCVTIVRHFRAQFRAQLSS